jgi:hypothetical protein
VESHDVDIGAFYRFCYFHDAQSETAIVYGYYEILEHILMSGSGQLQLQHTTAGH